MDRLKTPSKVEIPFVSIASYLNAARDGMEKREKENQNC